MENKSTTSRRGFLNTLGVAVGGAGVAGAGLIGGARVLKAAQEPAKGRIPETPFKVGHMTFLTSAAAVLGEPSLKGHTMAAEEINAQGGLLGKRKIETITADEAAGTDANVKELRRMKLEGNIDLFTGVISSGNSPALGPVAEELGLLTIFTDGCTDFLFDVADPNPKYVFRITNIQSASENWPKLGSTDFSSHITKILSSQPDLLYTSVWGGDYVAFYKQALRYGLFDKMKVATTLAFGVVPHAIGKDHPEGVLAGVHSN